VAIVGQAVAPPLFDTMVVLGQQRVVRRMRDAIQSLEKVEAKERARLRLIYFDTDVIHRIGETFAERELPSDLRQRIVISPIAILEALSHLTLASENILRQIQAIHNWVDPHNASLLPWPCEVIAQLGFHAKPASDDVIANVGKAINACLTANSADDVRESAGKLKDWLDKRKGSYAQNFQRLVGSYRDHPLTDEEFPEFWVEGIARRVNVDPKSRPTTEIVSTLSAYYEYDKERLKVAISNPQYVPDPNDLLDSEQLVYLADPTRLFLVCDRGYQARIKHSPQLKQIYKSSHEELSTAQGVEKLLRDRII